MLKNMSKVDISRLPYETPNLGKQKRSQGVVWITGLSGAGKTTVASLLQESLKTRNLRPILLDGDEVRNVLSLTENYSWDERKKIAFIYAKFAKLLADQGFWVLVASISMFEEVRQWNRRNNKGYFEIYLKLSERDRMVRDFKGLYSTNQEMVQINEFYEEPQNPDLVFDSYQGLSPEKIVEEIQKLILAFEKTS